MNIQKGNGKAMSKVLIIDPPSGWMYGYPAVYNKSKDETIEEWALRKGYPQKLIDQGMLKYCRFWEKEI